MNIDKDILIDFYVNKKLTDKKISELYGCSENAIRIKRKKFNIETIDRFLERKNFLSALSNDELKNIIKNSNYRAIQEQLGLSCFTWKKELKRRGLNMKSTWRIEQYPELTREQIIMLIGSSLGDGGFTEDGRFFEAHAPAQYQYLLKKHAILKPFSCDIYKDYAHDGLFCYRFTTISHPYFKKFRDIFYEPNLRGKLIPLDFIKAFWHDDILGTWFCDDGHYDEKSGVFLIANKCPYPDQLYDFVTFLSWHYQAEFKIYTGSDIFNVKIPLSFRDQFIKIVLNVATPDMLYKVPESYRNLPGIKSEKKFLHPLYGDKIQGPLKLTELQKDILIGTIFGDSGIYQSGRGTAAYLISEHAWPQIEYLKTKAELFKPLTCQIYNNKPNSKNQDYQIGFRTYVTEELGFYRNLFYTQLVPGKKHLQRNILKPELWDLLKPISLAYWLMDDGKKYGKGIFIVIGKRFYYDKKVLESLVNSLNDKFSIDLKVREEKLCYGVYANQNSKFIELIRPFILSYFDYKVSLPREQLGSFYEQFDWYKKWSIIKKTVVSFLETNRSPNYFTVGTFKCLCGKTFDSKLKCSRHESTCKSYRIEYKKKIELRNNGFIEENVDYVQCKECLYKAEDLTRHLFEAKYPHISFKEYRIKYPDQKYVAFKVVERRTQTRLKNKIFKRKDSYVGL